MKLSMLLIFVAAFLASCGSKPLTEAECKTLSAKEIEFAISHVSATDRAGYKAFLSKRANDAIPRCMAGKTYNRSDYECMVNARDAHGIGACIAAANKRLGQ